MTENQWIQLLSTENQARRLAEYGLRFLQQDEGQPAATVYDKVEQFHRDSVACAVSALALRANAPRVLREEALRYAGKGDPQGVPCFGSKLPVPPEKAVVANCSAVREWDSNGTNFGYNPRTGDVRGEFGHNDYYPVAVAAAQLAGWNGLRTLKAMICLDEIRGRLAEVFALRDHKIDHVVHGAIASTVVYGAVLGATVDEIEAAIGMLVAHYVPFRAIRAGTQLSDSKGASAALSAEAAVLSMQRAMQGFVGPRDIFRNPQAIFCLFEPPQQPDSSPFDLSLAIRGDDFAVMGMHFKIGLYEHQSAGALQALIELLTANPALLETVEDWQRIQVSLYEPACSIIADPAKQDPQTRQSADHSMVYILSTTLRKALESGCTDWANLMLMPEDYDRSNLMNPLTRRIMQLIQIVHGGPEFDARYPDGIPSKLDIEHKTLGPVSSQLVMYPEGHARNTSGRLDELLQLKFRKLAAHGVANVDELYDSLTGLQDATASDIRALYDFEITEHPKPVTD